MMTSVTTQQPTQEVQPPKPIAKPYMWREKRIKECQVNSILLALLSGGNNKRT